MHPLCLLISLTVAVLTGKQNGEMALESSAHFRERAKIVGLSEECVELMFSFGWNSMGTFAFSCSQAPGGADDSPFMRDVVTPLLGVDPDRSGVASLRRLFFEAYTFMLQDMRSRVDRNEDDPPRKLPRIEREDRVASVRLRLPGARLTEEREPGTTVVYLFSQMAEDGILKYLPWNRVVSLRHEQSHGRMAKEWRPNKQGVISEKMIRETPAQESSTMFRLDAMMSRRGVALEAARLMSFESHQLISDRLFSALEDEPADPSAYEVTSMAQAAKADEDICLQLSKLCKSGIARRPSGVYPLEEHLRTVLDGVRVHQLLSPLPKAKSSTAPAIPNAKKAARKQQQLASAAAAAAAASKAPGGLAAAWSLIADIVNNPTFELTFILIAVPCGTFSRAREIPIPAWQRKQGAPSPKPLRSDEFPSGLPHLTGSDDIRVREANALALFASSMFACGRLNQVLVVIENPRSSILWLMPCVLDAVSHKFQSLIPACAPRHDALTSPEPRHIPHCSTPKLPSPSMAVPFGPANETEFEVKAVVKVNAFFQPRFSQFGALVPEFRSHKLV